MQKGSARNRGEGRIVEAKAFERGGAEVLTQGARRKCRSKHPVLKPAGYGSAEKASVYARSAVEHHLAGLKRLHPRVDLAHGTFGGKKLAGGHVD